MTIKLSSKKGSKRVMLKNIQEANSSPRWSHIESGAANRGAQDLSFVNCSLPISSPMNSRTAWARTRLRSTAATRTAPGVEELTAPLKKPRPTCWTLRAAIPDDAGGQGRRHATCSAPARAGAERNFTPRIWRRLSARCVLACRIPTPRQWRCSPIFSG